MYLQSFIQICFSVLELELEKDKNRTAILSDHWMYRRTTYNATQQV